MMSATVSIASSYHPYPTEPIKRHSNVNVAPKRSVFNTQYAEIPKKEYKLVAYQPGFYLVKHHDASDGTAELDESFEPEEPLLRRTFSNAFDHNKEAETSNNEHRFVEDNSI
jgi:hypothetical protein